MSSKNAPITWEPVSEDRYYEMLGAVPAIAWDGRAFLVGEPRNHDAETGEPLFQAFRERDGMFEASSRAMTRSEFHESKGKP